MNIQFMRDPDSLQWLRDVHNVPADMKSAIVAGNEDCPNRIDAWRSSDPDYDEAPNWTSTPLADALAAS